MIEIVRTSNIWILFDLEQEKQNKNRRFKMLTLKISDGSNIKEHIMSTCCNVVFSVVSLQNDVRIPINITRWPRTQYIRRIYNQARGGLSLYSSVWRWAWFNVADSHQFLPVSSFAARDVPPLTLLQQKFQNLRFSKFLSSVIGAMSLSVVLFLVMPHYKFTYCLHYWTLLKLV